MRLPYGDIVSRVRLHEQLFRPIEKYYNNVGRGHQWYNTPKVWRQRKVENRKTLSSENED